MSVYKTYYLTALVIFAIFVSDAQSGSIGAVARRTVRRQSVVERYNQVGLAQMNDLNSRTTFEYTRRAIDRHTQQQLESQRRATPPDAPNRPVRRQALVIAVAIPVHQSTIDLTNPTEPSTARLGAYAFTCVCVCVSVHVCACVSVRVYIYICMCVHAWCPCMLMYTRAKTQLEELSTKR